MKRFVLVYIDIDHERERKTNLSMTSYMLIAISIYDTGNILLYKMLKDSYIKSLMLNP